MIYVMSVVYSIFKVYPSDMGLKLIPKQTQLRKMLRDMQWVPMNDRMDRTIDKSEVL